MISVFTTQEFSSSATVSGSSWRQAGVDSALVEMYPVMGPQPGDASAELVLTDLPHEGAAVETVREFDEQENDWRPKHQRRFLELVKAKALSKITPEQQRELDRLQSLRRFAHHPRTSDEIVLEYRRREATRELTQALTKYVTILALTNTTRRAAEEET